MQHFDAASLRETAMCEDSIEPVLCIAIFGEDNDPLLVPLAAGSKVDLEPGDELMRFGVESGGSALRPVLQLVQDFRFGFGGRPESPRRKQAGVFASYTFGPPGKRVKIILLDGRYHREKPGATADMLGSEQWQWLEQQLTASDADVHLIGSGIQVIASEHPYEKWAEFPQSRQRLFDLVARSGARNVIFLSGDRHLGEISRFSDPRISQPLYDITSSGMTHHAKDNFFHSFTHETNQFRCGKNFVDLNFGLIQFNWDARAPTATLQIRDANNAVRIEEKIGLAITK